MRSAQGTVVMDQFDALSGACGATVGGEAAIGAGDILVDGAHYFFHDGRTLAKGTELASVDIPLDYDIGFTVTPAAEAVDGWGDIIHITATGDNCCEYGDRVPGVWFKPGTRALHIRDGSNEEGTGGCDPSEELPAGTPTTVRVEIRSASIVVLFNEVIVPMHPHPGAISSVPLCAPQRTLSWGTAYTPCRARRSRSAARTAKLTRARRSRRRGCLHLTPGMRQQTQTSATST
jgi:hypothetical protein